MLCVHVCDLLFHLFSHFYFYVVLMVGLGFAESSVFNCLFVLEQRHDETGNARNGQECTQTSKDALLLA